jgi:hypothetical protein
MVNSIKPRSLDRMGCEERERVLAMNIRLALAAVALAAALPHAADAGPILTTNFSTWAANVGSFHNTSTGFGDGNTQSTITLSDGAKLFTSNPVTDLQPIGGPSPFSGDWATKWDGGSYVGDVFDTDSTGGLTFYTKLTLSFNGLSALGMELEPDVPLGGGQDHFIVTLSDGTSITTIPTTFNPGDEASQFIGFYDGDGITSMTIAVASSPDFAIGNIDDVPEPGSMGLLASAFGLLMLIRRRD